MHDRIHCQQLVIVINCCASPHALPSSGPQVPFARQTRLRLPVKPGAHVATQDWLTGVKVQEKVALGGLPGGMPMQANPHEFKCHSQQQQQQQDSSSSSSSEE